ncbi:MAG TPA: ABC transporter substrate-binding protein [Anaeromyxobacteraceae bacterium]|nr:ABC transporter substrate-binding protein [Anaeromyxobacteraceae bacterium]
MRIHVWCLSLAAVVGSGLSTGARAAETAKIGAALSMTGAAAVYGATQKAGIQLAVEEINRSGALKGVKLEALVEDDGSTKEQGINVYQRFINRDRVSAIIGPTLSTTATAADPIAQASRVPVLAISNTSPTGITDIGNYIWRVSLTEKQVIPGALRRAKAKLGFQTAAVLYGNDDVFTKAGYDVMKVALQEEGVKVLGTQTFAKTDRDYNAQLTALLAHKPDVLMLSALADNGSAIVIQARQLGYKGPIMGGNGLNSPAFVKNGGPAAEGALVGTSWNAVSTDPVNQRFIAAMKARGVSPDQFAAQAYTGVYVIAEAIKLAGYKAGREDIRAGFAKVKNLDTPLGRFSFTPSRDGQHEPALQQVKGGKFVILQ